MKLKHTLVAGTTTAALLLPIAGAGAQDYYPVKLKPRVTLSVKPKRDRKKPFVYRGTGRVKLPSGVTKASGCKGTVTIRIKQKKRTVGKQTTKLRSNCKYSRRVVVKRKLRKPRRRGSLRVIATFSGNSVLTAKNSPSKFVKYGRK